MNDKESMWCCFEGAVGRVRTAIDDETLQVDLLRGVSRNQGIGEEFLTGETCMDLKLDEVPTIECPVGFSGFAGETCREFALDINYWYVFYLMS